MRDLSHNISVVPSLSSAARTGAVNGSTIDLQGYNSALLTAHFGTYTDGTFTPAMQESNDGSTWTNVAAGDLTGSYSVVSTSSGSGTVQKAGYIGNMRYIRISLGVTGATTGAIFGSVAILGDPAAAPV